MHSSSMHMRCVVWSKPTRHSIYCNCRVSVLMVHTLSSAWCKILQHARSRLHSLRLRNACSSPWISKYIWVWVSQRTDSTAKKEKNWSAIQSHLVLHVAFTMFVFQFRFPNLARGCRPGDRSAQHLPHRNGVVPTLVANVCGVWGTCWNCWGMNAVIV